MGAEMEAKRGQKWGKSGAEKHSLEPTVTNRKFRIAGEKKGS